MRNAARLKVLQRFFSLNLMVLSSSFSHAQQSACNLEAVVTKPISGIPILEWDDALENSLGDQLIVAAAPGEFEPGSIVIHDKKGQCTAVEFGLDDFVLVGNTARTISKDHIKIRYVKKWFQGGTAWTGIGSSSTRKLTPELLLNNPLLVKANPATQRNQLLVRNSLASQYVDVSAYASKRGRETPSVEQMDVRDEATLQPIDLDTESQQIFVTFLAPEGTWSGEYRSTLRIRRAGIDVLDIPVSFEVLPFKLDPPALEYSIFYRGQLSNTAGTISSEQKSEQQYRAELTNMLQHGVTNPNIYQSFDSTSLLKKALEIRREVGLTNKNIYYLGKSASIAQAADARTDLSKSASIMRQMCSILGYSDLYFFGKDEAKGALLNQQLSSWQYARDSLGLKVFTTGYKGTFDSVGQQLDLFVLAGEPNSEEIAKFHSAGKRVMTYAYPQSGPENPELFRRNFGINLLAQGSDGAMTYAYQDSFAFIWNDFDHEEFRDHNFAYPTTDGVIDTIAWEGFREAVDDVRYLTTLKNMLAKVKSTCGKKDCSDAMANASVTFSTVNVKSSSRDLDDTRKQIIAAIRMMVPFSGATSPPYPPEFQVTPKKN
jgi:hypothetical protein